MLILIGGYKPKCILFEQVSPTAAFSPEMGSTATPILGSVKIGNMSVTRHQVPVTPAWAITEYKAQWSTYDRVTLALAINMHLLTGDTVQPMFS